MYISRGILSVNAAGNIIKPWKVCVDPRIKARPCLPLEGWVQVCTTCTCTCVCVQEEETIPEENGCLSVSAGGLEGRRPGYSGSLERNLQPPQVTHPTCTCRLYMSNVRLFVYMHVHCIHMYHMSIIIIVTL